MSRARPGRPTLFEGALVAAAASVSGAALWFVAASTLPPAVAPRLIVSALACGYLVYLLARSGERTGRISAVALFGAVAAGAWLADLPLAPFTAAHFGIVWLIRSLYYHASVFASLADLALNGLAAAVAAWAAARTGSVLMALWCLFLVQALYCLIPPDLRAPRERGSPPPGETDRFDRAHRRAEAAARKLSSAR